MVFWGVSWLELLPLAVFAWGLPFPLSLYRSLWPSDGLRLVQVTRLSADWQLGQGPTGPRPLRRLSGRRWVSEWVFLKSALTGPTLSCFPFATHWDWRVESSQNRLDKLCFVSGHDHINNIWLKISLICFSLLFPELEWRNGFFGLDVAWQLDNLGFEMQLYLQLRRSKQCPWSHNCLCGTTWFELHYLMQSNKTNCSLWVIALNDAKLLLHLLTSQIYQIIT